MFVIAVVLLEIQIETQGILFSFKCEPFKYMSIVNKLNQKHCLHLVLDIIYLYIFITGPETSPLKIVFG